MNELSSACSGTAGGLLSDSTQSVAYTELPSLFQKIRAELDASGLDRNELTGVACANDVGSALLVLFMLEEERPCVLFPAGRVGTLPSHCRVAVSSMSEPGNFRFRVERLGSPDQPAPKTPAAGSPRGVCVMTSGSTGRPKIVMHTHAGLVRNARATIDRLGVVPHDRIGIPVPIFHMYGLGAALVPAVLAGASVDLQDRSNVMRFVARERAFDPTVVFLTPSTCHQFLASRHGKREYRLTVVAGDRFPEPAFRQYEERFGTVVSLYGSTELGAVAAGDPLEPLELRASAVGRPLPDVELSARNDGDPGELLVRHASAYAGYLDDEGGLVAADCPEGWHRTRDLARLSSTGHLTLFGRADHAVKRDGVLVFFADLEAKLGELPGVARTVIVSGDWTVRGAALIACCVAAPGFELDEASLRRAAREVLPGHAVPDRFVFLAELPVLPTGKPDREALKRGLGGTMQ